MSVFVSENGLDYHYNIVQKYFTKSAIPPRHIFLITRESEDEQRPVLVSAHPLLKIRQKSSFPETYIPQPTCYIDFRMKDNVFNAYIGFIYLGQI